MRSFWLVARHEYLHTAARRGFVITTLAIPLGMVALIAMIILAENLTRNNAPLGYVDQAGILDASLYAALPDADRRAELRAFADRETALAALEAGQIQAFFVLPADYPQTQHTELYYLDEWPDNDAWSDLDDLVRTSLTASLPPDIQHRLLEGPNVTVYDTASNREFSERGIVNMILPFAATFFFYFATLLASGYMLGVVAGEKENRTMEIMVTSITPGQLIGGKTVGLLAASLTQLTIYAIAVVVGLWVAAPYVVELQQATVPWGYLAMMFLFFFPAYGLLAAVMVAIGGAVTEVQQGQQIAGILNLFFMIPIFALPLIFENPGHPLIVFFTIFPTTSFLTISLRWGLGTIPLWQIGAGWLVLVATTSLMIWIAARVFRAGMLHYGQPLTLKTAWAALKEQ